jgi:hypothetical protein
MKCEVKVAKRQVDECNTGVGQNDLGSRRVGTFDGGNFADPEFGEVLDHHPAIVMV